MRRLIFVILVLSSVVIGLWCLHNPPASEPLNLFVQPSAHSFYLTAEDPFLSFDLYANQATLDYVHEDILQSAFLTHEAGPHTLALDLVHHEVTLLWAEDETVYRHRLHFEAPLTQTRPWHLQDATLTLHFVERLTLRIPLGSVHLYWTSNDTLLSLEALHPLVVQDDEQSRLEGVYVRVFNPNPHTLCVLSVTPGDPFMTLHWALTMDAFMKGQAFKDYDAEHHQCLAPNTSQSLILRWDDQRHWRRFPLVFKIQEGSNVETFMLPSFTYQETYLAPPQSQRQSLEIRDGD